jgi:hypothetical protein
MALRTGIEGSFTAMHTACMKLLEVLALTATVRSHSPIISLLHLCCVLAPACLPRLMCQGPTASHKLADASAAVVPTLGGAEGRAQLGVVATDVAKSFSLATQEMVAIVKPRAEKLGKMAL